MLETVLRMLSETKSRLFSGRIPYLKFLVFSFLLFIPFGKVVYSQEIADESITPPDANLIYNHQAVGGLSIHTEGWGFYFRKAKILDIYKKIFWEAEFVTMHNQQEYKVSNPNQPEATPYYFGKLNGMGIFRGGVGVSRMIWRKNDLSCVQIDAVYAIGASLGVLKPVYLDILVSAPNGDQLPPIPERYDPYKDTPANIYGRASVFDGLGELSFYPGLYGKAGLNFDFANRHRTIKSIETGVVVDAYKNVVPMMAFTKNNQIFINLFLSFSIGSRWI